jgi:hypothetical protein
MSSERRCCQIDERASHGQGVVSRGRATVLSVPCARSRSVM